MAEHNGTPLQPHHSHLDPLTLPLQGSALIEASAGTGKTFTIAILYVRLILGHGQPLNSPLSRLLPPGVLVVTFTEAATKELRERIRSRLAQAADVFSGELDPGDAGSDAAVLFALRDREYPDPASWPECRRKLLLAAEWMDEAAVSTIHSWCGRMLREHAFDSGSLFQLVLETDQSDLLDEVVRDYWRTFVYPLRPEQINEVSRHWRDPGQLRAAVNGLLGDLSGPDSPSVQHNHASDEPADVAECIDRALRQHQERAAALRRHPWARWCDEIAPLLNEWQTSKRIHHSTVRAMRTAWEKLLNWVDDPGQSADQLTGNGFINQTPAGLAEKLGDSGEIPDHPAFEAIEEVLAFAQRPPDVRADVLCHAARWISVRLEAEKQRRGEMGLNDLLVRLDGALHGPRGEQLADTIRRQFPAVLIDEFQDTDPVQYRIFNRIYRIDHNDRRTCTLMIGDPKQAIYGFRGGDIYTYMQAREAVAGRIWTLARNFRSSKAMVDAVNCVFEHAESHSEDGAFLFGRGSRAPLPFQAVEANGTARDWVVMETGNGTEDRPVQPSLTFWTLDREWDSDKPAPLAKGRATAELAEACASEIVRLLTLAQQGKAGFVARDAGVEPQALEPGDIAVLVNNRNEAAVVREALARRGVKTVYLSDRDSVLTSVVALDLLGWLRACADPHQLARVRAALATPTLGRSWQELNRLLVDETVLEQEIERFVGYREQWLQRGVLPMLHSLLMDFEVPARLLQRADGERQLTDILHIAELLQQASQEVEGEHALVDHYTRLLHASDEDEHRILRLESDAHLVKVVTVHKSKGLEYPLVFLPFGTSFRATASSYNKPIYVRYHDDQGQPVTVFHPQPEDIARADRERLGEDVRKLYVALTRARYATWVGVAAVKDWGDSGLGYLLGGSAGESQPLMETLEALSAPGDIIAISEAPQPGHEIYIAAEPQAVGDAMMPLRPVRDPWWIASYSAIRYGGRTGSGRIWVDAAEDAEGQNLLEESAGGEVPRHVEAQSFSAAQGAQGWHRFPRGAEAGSFLHNVLEWSCQQGFAHLVSQPELLRDQLILRCQSRGWEEWADLLAQWVMTLITTPLPLPGAATAVSLSGLDSVYPEMEFWLESCEVSTAVVDRLVTEHTLEQADRPRVEGQRFNGMLKGFIDLVFEHEGRYYLLDYKSNALGDSDGDYTRTAMAHAILEHRYDLQYALYLLALHRLLKVRLPDYHYDAHIGGAVYLFLRGIRGPTRGVFADKPSRGVIEQLDALFDGVAVAAEVLA